MLTGEAPPGYCDVIASACGTARGQSFLQCVIMTVNLPNRASSRAAIMPTAPAAAGTRRASAVWRLARPPRGGTAGKQSTAARRAQATVLAALQQPAPETFALFDDVMLISEGVVLFHGPRPDALPFFARLGFACPPRKDPAGFLQEVSSARDQAVRPGPARPAACGCVAPGSRGCLLAVFVPVAHAPVQQSWYNDWPGGSALCCMVIHTTCTHVCHHTLLPQHACSSLRAAARGWSEAAAHQARRRSPAARAAILGGQGRVRARAGARHRGRLALLQLGAGGRGCARYAAAALARRRRRARLGALRAAGCAAGGLGAARPEARGACASRCIGCIEGSRRLLEALFLVSALHQPRAHGPALDRPAQAGARSRRACSGSGC